MISRDEIVGLLAEHDRDPAGLLVRLDRLHRDRGGDPHAASLQFLTRLRFDESEARAQWEKIAERQRELTRALGRDPGIRVAAFDHLVHSRRAIRSPRLADLGRAECDPGTDRLTGLATDRTFRSRLLREVRRARRYGDTLAVAVFDLDDFGVVNRRLGPAGADRILREVAALLRSLTRAVDLAGRPGDDELAVLLTDTDTRGARIVADRLRRAVRDRFVAAASTGDPIRLTLSAGAAAYPGDASTADGLLRVAAAELYVAKATGGDAVRCPDHA